MISLILRTTAGFLMPLLLMLSIFILLRGHDEPGGGFIGGLLAASAFALYAVAFDADTTRRVLRVDPIVFIGTGLLAAGGAGVLPMLAGRPFLTGLWATVGGGAALELSTVLIFDIGVYLTVLGVVLVIVLSLYEE